MPDGNDGVDHVGGKHADAGGAKPVMNRRRALAGLGATVVGVGLAATLDADPAMAATTGLKSEQDGTPLPVGQYLNFESASFCRDRRYVEQKHRLDLLGPDSHGSRGNGV